MGDDGATRGRATRRGQAPAESSTLKADDDSDHEEDGAGSSWKQEMESIMAGAPRRPESPTVRSPPWIPRSVAW